MHGEAEVVFIRYNGDIRFLCPFGGAGSPTQQWTGCALQTHHQQAEGWETGTGRDQPTTITQTERIRSGENKQPLTSEKRPGHIEQIEYSRVGLIYWRPLD
ncbi:hypothetical protein PoB_005617100 [Plakobranchus ocellatus]|uniref:Uncharacterized protein n=1 Tax=Plakobranchus ocellatus TaxID=259542 RepID=A0AAV4C2T0_9GAST|nr:hypothetical protein PoB_005617100 [Plakobranchus ocellatus]